MPQDFNRGVPPTGYNSNHRPDLSSTESRITSHWVPSCNHWSIDITSTKSVPIVKLSPGLLRRHWSKQYLQEKFPGPQSSNAVIPIPFLPPTGYYSPLTWKTFWSLSLPHSVVTCWWRLLKESLSTQVALNAKYPRRFPSPLCRICGMAPESTYHFIVGCAAKWSFWVTALQHLSILDSPLPYEVWYILTSVFYLNGRMVEQEIIELLGSILEILWKYHWHCAISTQTCSTTTALAMLASSTNLQITVNAYADSISDSE